MTAKSIWIELDSLHSSILLRGIRDGIMPNLAKLMARCGATRVDYEIPLQVAAWATAHTGLSVADHGATAFDQRIPGTYRMRIEPRPVKPGSTYWEILGRSGKRVLVINSHSDARGERHSAQRVGDACRRPACQGHVLSPRDRREP